MKTRTFINFVHAHASFLKAMWPFVCAIVVGGLFTAITHHIELGIITGAVAFWFFRNTLRDDAEGFFRANQLGENPAPYPESEAIHQEDARGSDDTTAPKAGAGDLPEKMRDWMMSPQYSYREENICRDD